MARQRRRIQDLLESCFALFSSPSDINVSSTSMYIPTTDTVDTTLSFLTYSDRTIPTVTELTMDSSFITDSTLGNSTFILDSTHSTSSDTDLLYIPTDSTIYNCSTPMTTSPTGTDTTPSFLTYSDRTISTDTVLTMDFSFITDSTIGNSTCILDSTLSSITFDTDSLSIPTDTVITIPSVPTETETETTPSTRRRRAAVLLTLYFVLPPFLIFLLLSPLLLLLG